MGKRTRPAQADIACAVDGAHGSRARQAWPRRLQRVSGVHTQQVAGAGVTLAETRGGMWASSGQGEEGSIRAPRGCCCFAISTPSFVWLDELCETLQLPAGSQIPFPGKGSASVLAMRRAPVRPFPGPHLPSQFHWKTWAPFCLGPCPTPLPRCLARIEPSISRTLRNGNRCASTAKPSATPVASMAAFRCGHLTTSDFMETPSESIQTPRSKPLVFSRAPFFHDREPTSLLGVISQGPHLF
jgi:hypothetical protein